MRLVHLQHLPPESRSLIRLRDFVVIPAAPGIANSPRLTHIPLSYFAAVRSYSSSPSFLSPSQRALSRPIILGTRTYHIKPLPHPILCMYAIARPAPNAAKQGLPQVPQERPSLTRFVPHRTATNDVHRGLGRTLHCTALGAVEERSASSIAIFRAWLCSIAEPVRWAVIKVDHDDVWKWSCVRRRANCRWNHGSFRPRKWRPDA